MEVILDRIEEKQEKNCFICLENENEVEHLIGIAFDELDHPDRDDVFLCDGCISEASAILEEVRFRKRVSDEIKRLQEEST